MKFIQFEQQRNNALIRVNRDSGTCETIIKQLTLMLWESQKERRKSGTENVLKEIIVDNSPYSGGRHTPTYSMRS